MVPEERDGFVRSLAAFFDECVQEARETDDADAPSLRTVLERHFEAYPRALPVVALNVQPHQFVNLDAAVAHVVEQHGGGETVGVGGGDQRHHFSFGDLIQRSSRFGGYPVAAVERTTQASGPDRQTQVVSFGVHLFRHEGRPVAVLQRQQKARFGRDEAAIEVMAPSGRAEPVLAEIRAAMVEHSVFRRQILTLGPTDDTFRPSVSGVSFHRRPALTAAEIVLPPGTLGRIERHVVGVARHREELRAAAST
jgi:hypothetical protein